MKRVIIIGSSIAGMLTAKSLSRYFSEVIIIERNKLPNIVESRKGVPQGNQIHVLLSRGLKIFQKYFPDTIKLLKKNGAYEFDFGEVYWQQHKRWKAYGKIGITSYSQTRPVLDWVLLQQLKETPNIKIIEEFSVEELIYDTATNTVKGIKLHNNKDNTIIDKFADLVIDTSGRASRSINWFESWGIETPEIKQVEVNIKYVSRLYEIPAGMEDSFPSIISSHQPPFTSKIGVIFRVENKILITLAGMLGNYPPTTEEGFLEFARNLDTSILYETIKQLIPISDFRSYGFRASTWKQYHKMNNFPNGYLVLGDAYCSLNPIYAQGMTVSALQVEILDNIMQKGLKNLSKIHRTFYKKSRGLIDMAWQFSTSEDLRFPQVIGDRPLPQKFLSKFSKQIFYSSHNPKIYKVFVEVINFNKSQYVLFNPVFLIRVLLTRLFSNNKLIPNFKELKNLKPALIV